MIQYAKAQPLAVSRWLSAFKSWLSANSYQLSAGFTGGEA